MTSFRCGSEIDAAQRSMPDLAPTVIQFATGLKRRAGSGA